MNKATRDIVFQKYGGKCAYCGCELQKGWNIDHIEPHWHTVNEAQAAKWGIKKGAHDISNFNPSCPRCNRWKSTFTIEQFRQEIQLQVQRLNSYSNNYRMAKDFNLIRETEAEVVFYYETLNTNINQ